MIPLPAFARVAALSALLLSSGAAHPTAGIAQEDARALVSRASSVYRGLQSLRADFDQLIQNPMIGDQASRGVLIQSGQARLAMRFSEPEGEAIVIDGEYIWVYTPSTTPGQVLRMPLRWVKDRVLRRRPVLTEWTDPGTSSRAA